MTEIVQIPLRISNAFLIIGKKMVLVDTGSPGEESKILKAIAGTGKRIQDLALILHTHIHVDHCGSTAALKQQSDALVAVHRSESGIFIEGKNAPIIPINLFAKIITLALRDGHDGCGIDLLIDDELDLRPYGIEGKAVATPGHTTGSLSVFLDNGSIIVGDLLGGGRLLGLFQPEKPRYHHWYTDLDIAKKSIAKIMETDPVKIYAGHGGPLKGKEAVRYFCGKPNESRL